MKILALMGSKRKFGNSDVLLLKAVESAKTLGAEVEIIRLTDLEIEFCRGDLACVYRGKCSIQDDLTLLIEKVIKSDGLILAAPTYVLGTAGIIKTIADRGLMLSPFLRELQGKVRKAVTISVAGNQKWNPSGLEGINHLAWILGFQVVDYLEAFAPGPAEVLLDERNIDAAYELGKKLFSAIENDLPPREPERNQCPVCFSRSWRWKSDGKVECPYCLTKGTAELQNGEIAVTPEKAGKHFWDLNFREEHLEDWVLPSKERYLKLRKEIKTRQKEFSKIQQETPIPNSVRH